MYLSYELKIVHYVVETICLKFCHKIQWRTYFLTFETKTYYENKNYILFTRSMYYEAILGLFLA